MRIFHVARAPSVLHSHYLLMIYCLSVRLMMGLLLCEWWLNFAVPYATFPVPVPAGLRTAARCGAGADGGGSSSRKECRGGGAHLRLPSPRGAPPLCPRRSSTALPVCPTAAPLLCPELAPGSSEELGLADLSAGALCWARQLEAGDRTRH